MNKKKSAFLFTSVLFISIVAAFLYLGWHRAESGTPGGVGFAQLNKPLPDLKAGEAEALVLYAAARLKGDPAPRLFPERLEKDVDPRICFISLADGKGGRKVASGAGQGLSEALDQALRNLQQDPLAKRFKWVKLDLVKGAQMLKNLDFEQPLPFDSSLFGLAVDGQLDKALLPEELSVLQAERTGKVSPEKANALLKETRVAPVAAEIERRASSFAVFRTISAFSDGMSAWPLFRGNRPWQTYTEKDIEQSLAWAGKFLARSVRKDGSFVYQYDPLLDREGQEYNILRHAGTVYAMLELYRKNRDPELLRAAEKALGYLIRQVKEGTVRGRAVKFVVERGEVKLGGNALAVLALAEYERATSDRRYRTEMEGLGEWMLATQAPDGRFTIHKQGYPDGKVSKFQSEYYPGEAVFALARVYGLTGERKWLDAADAGARYQLKVFSRLEDSKLPHDHWLLYGLNEVHRKRPRPEFLEGAMRFARVIIQAQHTQANQSQPDWDGGYYKPPRSAPTATRMEGLNSAYALARDFGTKEGAKRIREAVRRGTGFLLRIQVGPEVAMYCKNPEKSLGGFRESLDRPTIRIDYVQHSISAMINR